MYRDASLALRMVGAPIKRRALLCAGLSRNVRLLPKEGGYDSSACTTGVTNVNPVTLSSYSSLRSSDTKTL